MRRVRALREHGRAGRRIIRALGHDRHLKQSTIRLIGRPLSDQEMSGMQLPLETEQIMRKNAQLGLKDSLDKFKV